VLWVPDRRQTDHAAIAVVAVPLLDPTGLVLERRVVAFTLTDGDAATPRQIASALRARATAFVAPRAARLARLVTVASARAVAVEELLARGREQDRRLHPQPGLFDRRRATDRAPDPPDPIRSAARPQDVDHSIRDRDDARTPAVIIGRPRVLLVAPRRS
jgi:hypothetical protein